MKDKLQEIYDMTMDASTKLIDARIKIRDILNETKVDHDIKNAAKWKKVKVNG